MKLQNQRVRSPMPLSTSPNSSFSHPLFHATSISPPKRSTGINHLPDELLCVIFLLCIGLAEDWTGDGTKAVTRNGSALLMILCQVSFQWREIVLAYPKLWEVLNIGIIDNRKYPLQRRHLELRDAFGDVEETPWMYQEQVPRLGLWDNCFLRWWKANSRSQAAFRFRLGLFPGRQDQQQKSEPAQTVSSILANCSSAFLEVLLNARYLDLHPHFISALPLNMTMDKLETLVFSLPGNCSKPFNEAFAKFPFFIQSLPHLKKLRFTNLSLNPKKYVQIRYWVYHTTDDALWARLTHLDLTLQLVVDEFRSFIRKCGSLQIARIRLDLIDQKASFIAESNNIVQLKHLTSLTLEFVVRKWSWYMSTDIPLYLFQAMRFSQLTALSLIGIDQLRYLLQIDYLHCLLYATPSLESLHLYRIMPVVLDFTRRDHPPPMFGIIPSNSHFPAGGHAVPLVDIIPQLRKLRLDIPSPSVNPGELERYLRQILWCGWLAGLQQLVLCSLDLGEGTCQRAESLVEELRPVVQELEQQYQVGISVTSGRVEALDSELACVF